MRILVLSDIHANLPALEAVLAHAGYYDAVWCLGDIVGYGPQPNECVEMVRGLPGLECVMGNHDAAVTNSLDLEGFNQDARSSAEWTSKTLKLSNAVYLSALSKIRQTGQFTLAHGTPRNPIWEYMLNPFNALMNFGHFKTPFCIVGHTHVPAMFYLDPASDDVKSMDIQDGQLYLLSPQTQTILNPGSVGQPRDYDPKASYGIITVQGDRILWQVNRVSYAVDQVAQMILKLKLPAAHAERLLMGW